MSPVSSGEVSKSDRVFIASFGVPRYLVLKSYGLRILPSAPTKVQWLLENVNR